MVYNLKKKNLFEEKVHCLLFYRRIVKQTMQGMVQDYQFAFLWIWNEKQIDAIRIHEVPSCNLERNVQITNQYVQNVNWQTETDRKSGWAEWDGKFRWVKRPVAQKESKLFCDNIYQEIKKNNISSSLNPEPCLRKVIWNNRDGSRNTNKKTCSAEKTSPYSTWGPSVNR